MTIKRMNYFKGEFLQEKDFQEEQQYHVDMLRKHNKNLHTWGIADGLDVTTIVGEEKITISKGMAVDAQGRQTVLVNPKEIDISTFTATTFYLTISYNQHTTDPREDTGIKGDTRITEEPDILYPEMKPSDPSMQLILAKVTLKPNKTVDEIDLSERTHAGIVSGDLETNSIAFSLPVTQTNWPKIKGVVDSGMTGIEISHKTAINGDLSVTGKVAGRDVSVDGAKLDNHVGNKSNPHSTTAAHVGAPISIDGVRSPGGNIDLIKQNSITLSPDDTNNRITIGENHSGLKNNPHSTTAAHVGAPISIDGVRNPGGNIDLIKQNSITLSPDDTNNRITIGENHSGLKNNPHGTTAAQVGALSITGGTLGGNLHVNGRVSNAVATSTTSYTNALTVSASSSGNGTVNGLNLTSSGTGTGWKQSITSYASGNGPKRAGLFSAISGEGEDYTQALYAIANSSGSGGVAGLSIEAFGTGTGWKEGITINASGNGPKRAGLFIATSGEGEDSTQALYANANSSGSGQVTGLNLYSSGTGTGWKEGITINASGNGPKRAGNFYATSGEGEDSTQALYANANSSGSGQVTGLSIGAGGTGTGWKQGITSNASGNGPKRAGNFYATSGEGEDSTQALYANANSSGSGQVTGLRIGASGTGTGFKQGITINASGNGPKRAGLFSANSGEGEDSTQALYANASSSGSGGVTGLIIGAGGTGTGWKQGITSNASGNGPKRAGYFYATSGEGEDSAQALYANANSSGNGMVDGLRAYANSSGSGDVYGLFGNAYGAGTGRKYGVYGTASGGGTKYAGFFAGNVHVSGTLSKTSGTFLIDHPLDPYEKTLRHSFVESPEDLCLYRGKIKLDDKGRATIKMPEYFASLTKEENATVTLTPIGKKPFLLSYQWKNKFTAFTIFGESNAEATYIVLADRDDPSIRHHRRPVEEEKGNDNFEKGKLLCPEAYRKPSEMGIGYFEEEYRPPETESQQMMEEHKKIMEENEKMEEEHRKLMEENMQREEEHSKMTEKLREKEERRK